MTDVARQIPDVPADEASAGSLWSSIPARFRRRVGSGAYRAEIDGLRFFAIAIVVFGHLIERLQRFYPHVDAAAHNYWLLGVMSRPGIGVYLFFAVSGFILATQALKATDGPLTRNFLGAYFKRRVLRIEPPYLILLAVTWAALVATGYAPDNARQFATQPESLTLSLVSSIFYVHDLVWGAFPRLFPPGWSLEVEVQFYLVAPLLFFAYFRVKNRRARALFGCAVLLIGTIASLYTPQTLGPLHVWNSLLRFFHFFWLGILLADFQGAIARRLERITPGMAALIGWSALLGYLLTPDAPTSPMTAGGLALGLLIRLAALGTTALLFACVFAPHSRFRDFCAGPWVSLIGGACYSIYLTHIQLLQVMTGQFAKRFQDGSVLSLVGFSVVELGVVLIVGLAFYALIERTFMIPNWPQRAWARWSRASAPV